MILSNNNNNNTVLTLMFSPNVVGAGSSSTPATTIHNNVRSRVEFVELFSMEEVLCDSKSGTFLLDALLNRLEIDELSRENFVSKFKSSSSSTTSSASASASSSPSVDESLLSEFCTTYHVMIVILSCVGIRVYWPPSLSSSTSLPTLFLSHE